MAVATITITPELLFGYPVTIHQIEDDAEIPLIVLNEKKRCEKYLVPSMGCIICWQGESISSISVYSLITRPPLLLIYGHTSTKKILDDFVIAHHQLKDLEAYERCNSPSAHWACAHFWDLARKNFPKANYQANELPCKKALYHFLFLFSQEWHYYPIPFKRFGPLTAFPPYCETMKKSGTGNTNEELRLLASFKQRLCLDSPARSNTLLSPQAKIFSKFMDAALYEPENGYYAAGKVRFKHDSHNGHFRTYATDNWIFISSIVLYAFTTWMLLGNNKNNFVILELNGANGVFAEKFLTIVRLMKQLSPNGPWGMFASQLHYVICDISDALHELQKRRLKPLQQLFQIKFIHKSALDLTPEDALGGADFCFSNELFDCLPIEIVRCDAAGKLHCQIYFPAIPKTAGHCLHEIPRHLRPIVKFNNHVFKLFFGDQFASYHILDWQFVKKLKPHHDVVYLSAYLPIEYFPGVENYIRSNGFEHINAGERFAIPICYGQMATMLSEVVTGLAVHCDYGAAIHTVACDRVSVFSDKISNGKETELTKHFQEIDVTTDAQFNILIKALEKQHHSTLVYRPQSEMLDVFDAANTMELLIDLLQISGHTVNYQQQRKDLNYPTFKILIHTNEAIAPKFRDSPGFLISSPLQWQIDKVPTTYSVLPLGYVGYEKPLWEQTKHSDYPLYNSLTISPQEESEIIYVTLVEQCTLSPKTPVANLLSQSIWNKQLRHLNASDDKLAAEGTRTGCLRT